MMTNSLELTPGIGCTELASSGACRNLLFRILLQSKNRQYIRRGGWHLCTETCTENACANLWSRQSESTLAIVPILPIMTILLKNPRRKCRLSNGGDLASSIARGLLHEEHISRGKP